MLCHFYAFLLTYLAEFSLHKKNPSLMSWNRTLPNTELSPQTRSRQCVLCVQWHGQGLNSDFLYCLACIYPWLLGLLCLVCQMCSWNQPKISLFPYGFKLCTNPFLSYGIWVVGIRLLENIICTNSDRRYHCNMCRNPMPCIKSISGGKFNFVPIMKQHLKVTIQVRWMLSLSFNVSLH